MIVEILPHIGLGIARLSDRFRQDGAQQQQRLQCSRGDAEREAQLPAILLQHAIRQIR